MKQREMTAHEYGIIDSVDAILHKFGAVGRGNGQFDHPLAASSCTYVNDSGKNETIIAVSDAGNARIQILLQNGLVFSSLSCSILCHNVIHLTSACYFSSFCFLFCLPLFPSLSL